MKKNENEKAEAVKILKGLSDYEISDIICEICSKPEMRAAVVRGIEEADELKSQIAKEQFTIGSFVQFECSKRKFGYRIIIGKVTEIGRKNFKLDEYLVDKDGNLKLKTNDFGGQQRWRVSPRFLKPYAVKKAS